MKAVHLHRRQGDFRFEATDLAPEPLQPGEVRIRVRAVALNARDLAVARAAGDGTPIVPCSDGAGEVLEVGAGVDAWRPGDRVFANFFPDWVDGLPTEASTRAALGGGQHAGMLAEQVVLPAHALVRVPDGVSDEEAATMPCAGVTAWHALFGTPRLRPGDTVLLLGTGGVSIWALQLAHAAGLRTIVTSSSDDKLAQVRRLGADETVNHRSSPDWPAEVRRRSGGHGADLVVEVGGRGTLAGSIAATRVGGTIALVGGASGAFGGELAPFALIDGVQSLVGVLVGSRTMAERLVAFSAQRALRPVIDRRFALHEAAQAYAHLASGRHVGKVVILID